MKRHTGGLLMGWLVFCLAGCVLDADIVFKEKEAEPVRKHAAPVTPDQIKTDNAWSVYQALEREIDLETKAPRK